MHTSPFVTSQFSLIKIPSDGFLPVELTALFAFKDKVQTSINGAPDVLFKNKTPSPKRRDYKVLMCVEWTWISYGSSACWC